MNQVAQAEAFGRENAEKINLVVGKLAQAAHVVVSRLSTADEPLPAVMLNKVHESLETKNMQSLFSVLRYHAAELTRIPGLSILYWEWIDACGFFFDAVGAQWRYLNQSDRDRYLNWSEEGADRISLLA